MNNEVSPMMKQYLETKKQYNDCILFYRIGDFYETFFDDAKISSKELDIVLTGKDCGIGERAPMCGVPYHAVDSYISKLVSKGYKVAIADQIEDPRTVKGIVKREVQKVYTPGTILNQEILNSNVNNYIFCIYYKDCIFGISILDFSTGDLNVLIKNKINDVYDLFNMYSPKEVLINKNFDLLNIDIDVIKKEYNLNFYYLDDDNFDKNKLNYNEYLKKLIETIDNYDKYKNYNFVNSTIALYLYIKKNQKVELTHINKVKLIYDNKIMHLDSFTIKNLELLYNLNDNDKKKSLFGILDYTKTAMGSRLLRKFIEEPLKDINEIIDRQNAIKELNDNFIDCNELNEYLGSIYDIERILTRIIIGNANPRDLLLLKNSISILSYIKNLLKNFNSNILSSIHNNFDTLSDLYSLIEKSIMDEATISLHDGNIIKDNYNDELDNYRKSKTDGKIWLSKLEEKEIKETCINNLRIKYNRIFGYLFEISNSYKGEVPSHFIRKQTLANAERYTTEELEKLQSIILNAEDRIKILEYELFCEIRDTISKNIDRIKILANNIAYIDVFISLSLASKKNNYVCPNINNEGIINIIEGRHPIIEKILKDTTFVPNDTLLNNNNFLHIITGPNMAGKSTYMRQIAIICIMAHIGSFVPAKEANICIIDRIFTRIGASDDLSKGKSTFMVEMSEVSHILNNATNNSLIIMDEIGRGTSTYDGLSIAYATIEYICKNIKAKTLFSTHYHELTELEDKISEVSNYNISVIEKNGDIIFLRKIIKGHINKSYGIAVAKLAGLPNELIDNANYILKNLVKNDINSSDESLKDLNNDVNFNDCNNKNFNFIKKIKNLDVNNLTPLEALNLLYEIKEEIKNNEN